MTSPRPLPRSLFVALVLALVALAGACATNRTTAPSTTAPTPSTTATTIATPPTTLAPTTPTTLAPCAGSVVVLTDDEPAPCDVRPPQRIDLILHPDRYALGAGDAGLAAAEQMCLNMGGVPALWTNGRSLRCEDVDY